MTLGDIIREYASDHSMTQFIRDSGLSKAYVYMLINNRNNKGEPIVPSIDTINKAAKGMHKTFDEVFNSLDPDMMVTTKVEKTHRIPVLGRVAAGIPIDAIENVIDYEEVGYDADDYFALQIHGNSMEPRMYEGDVVIVRRQEDAENGDIVIITVNGDDATCKRLMKYPGGIALVSLNPIFQPMMFTKEDAEQKPIRVLGKVVEIRGKMLNI